ncbi:hypothetical protein PHJA_000047800 [Phtheirospermum japonicum]|uniref:Uncharacterized protein n=1 Tax=Phtheirospermum japonicum TaxID=374723 RepID=A0A830B303_9LAMI|nr:hypothetical protein PHJA_000047800 [Phtheirospermum japonicum]
MSMPGVDLAEVYYMRKLSKEKIKKVENNNKLESTQEKSLDEEYEAKVECASSSVGCFSRMFKKVYPSSNDPNIS